MSSVLICLLVGLLEALPMTLLVALPVVLLVALLVALQKGRKDHPFCRDQYFLTPSLLRRGPLAGWWRGPITERSLPVEGLDTPPQENSSVESDSQCLPPFVPYPQNNFKISRINNTLTYRRGGMVTNHFICQIYIASADQVSSPVINYLKQR